MVTTAPAGAEHLLGLCGDALVVVIRRGASEAAVLEALFHAEVARHVLASDAGCDSTDFGLPDGCATANHTRREMIIVPCQEPGLLSRC